jgi:hypothetical protein
LMQYRCSKHSVILSETRMQRTRVTPLRYLAATDASGGVARQQKITHAHESPFYHYAQFPHPFAITYRGKKYSRILFGQTSYGVLNTRQDRQFIQISQFLPDNFFPYFSIRMCKYNFCCIYVFSCFFVSQSFSYGI